MKRYIFIIIVVLFFPAQCVIQPWIYQASVASNKAAMEYFKTGVEVE